MVKASRTPTRRATKIIEVQTQPTDVPADLGKLILRSIAGALMVGHGTQKLLGTSGGPGLTATSQWMESLRLRPGKLWALVAGGSEAAGGTLTGIGALHPIGPIMTMSAMVMAFAKGHWGKPIWAMQGGGELALLDGLIAAEQLLQGPGKFSVDGLLGIKLPRWVAIGAGSSAAVMLAYGLWLSRPQSETTGVREEMSGDEAIATDASNLPLTAE